MNEYSSSAVEFDLCSRLGAVSLFVKRPVRIVRLLLYSGAESQQLIRDGLIRSLQNID